MKLVSLLLALVVPGLCQESAAIVRMERAARQQQQAALAQQQASVKRQMGAEQYRATIAAEFSSPIPPIAPAVAVCPSLSGGEVENLIANEASKHDLDPGLIRAVMHQESAFHPCAVSPKGALGLMQLMPATAEQFRVSDPFDPPQNVHAGASLLRELLDRYGGDLSLTLAAYNAGAQVIDRLQPADYPAETKAYVAAVSAELEKQR